MKKIFIILLLLSATLPGFSQIAKGTKTLSLYLNLYTVTNSQGDVDNTYSTFDIAPRFGYFITDRLELGLGLGYSYYKSKSENDLANSENETSQGVFRIEPYLKCYLPVSDRFYFDLVITPSIGFGSRTESNTFNGNTNETDYSVSTFGINLIPEFTYLFNNHWGVTLGVGKLSYTSTTVEQEDTNDDETTNAFQLYGNFAGSLSLGASYYF